MNTRSRICLALLLCGPMFNQFLADAESPTPSAESFQRGAACHLASSEGVPGALPQLKARIADIAASPKDAITL